MNPYSFPKGVFGIHFRWEHKLSCGQQPSTAGVTKDAAGQAQVLQHFQCLQRKYSLHRVQPLQQI